MVALYKSNSKYTLVKLELGGSSRQCEKKKVKLLKLMIGKCTYTKEVKHFTKRKATVSGK